MVNLKIFLSILLLPVLTNGQINSIKINPIVYFEGGVSKYYNQSPKDKNLIKRFEPDLSIPHVGIAVELEFKNRMFLSASVWEAEVTTSFKNKLNNGLCTGNYKGGTEKNNYTLFMLELGKYSGQRKIKIFKKQLQCNIRLGFGLGGGKLETLGINNTGGRLYLGYSTCYNGDNILLYDAFTRYISKKVLLAVPRIGIGFVTKTNRPVINIDLFAKFGFIKSLAVDWKYQRNIGGVKSDYSVSGITRGSAFGIQFSYPITIYKKAD